MVVIENNSCPSGQKSMPLLDDNQEQGSYRLMVERTFKPYLKNLRNKVKGRYENGVMHIWHQSEWHPIRAAFRYVTQKPWNRLPLNSKTKILNPTIACLAGGRNKMVAAKAYDIFNSYGSKKWVAKL